MTAVTNNIIPATTNKYQKVFAELIDNNNNIVYTGYDTIDVTYPSSTSETYTYKYNSGTVKTVTLVYTDATKCNLLSVTRS